MTNIGLVLMIWLVAGRDTEVTQVADIISDCPGEGVLSRAGVGAKFDEICRKIDEQMRKLQPYNSEVLKAGLNYMESRRDGTSAAGTSYREALRKKHEEWSASRIDMTARKVVKDACGPTYWMCRFLFEAPAEELSKAYYLGVQVKGKPFGFVDRQSPLTVDGGGHLRILRIPLPRCEGPGTMSGFVIYDYYAARYPRRKKWW